MLFLFFSFALALALAFAEMLHFFNSSQTFLLNPMMLSNVLYQDKALSRSERTNSSHLLWSFRWRRAILLCDTQQNDIRLTDSFWNDIEHDEYHNDIHAELHSDGDTQQSYTWPKDIWQKDKSPKMTIQQKYNLIK